MQSVIFLALVIIGITLYKFMKDLPHIIKVEKAKQNGRDYIGVGYAGTCAMIERLYDDKNVKKGAFPESLDECFYLLQGENVELADEVKTKERNYYRIREEAGDNIAYLSMICKICDDRIKTK